MTSDVIADALERLADGIRTVAAALREEGSEAMARAHGPKLLESSEHVLLTPKQLAAELNVAEQTLAKWRLSGVGPRYSKFGRLIRYDRAEVLRWVDERRYAHTAEQQKRGRRR